MVFIYLVDAESTHHFLSPRAGDVSSLSRETRGPIIIGRSPAYPTYGAALTPPRAGSTTLPSLRHGGIYDPCSGEGKITDDQAALMIGSRMALRDDYVRSDLSN